MTMRARRLAVLAMLALGVAGPAQAADAVPKGAQDLLAGSWEFVSNLGTDAAGGKVDRWGPGAKGLLILAADGHYSFMIERADIPKFASDNAMKGTADEYMAVGKGFNAHCGTWTYDDVSKTLITNVVVASFPNMVGRTQKRVISALSDSELRYTNFATNTGAVDEVVWRRAQ